MIVFLVTHLHRITKICVLLKLTDNTFWIWWQGSVQHQPAEAKHHPASFLRNIPVTTSKRQHITEPDLLPKSQELKYGRNILMDI